MKISRRHGAFMQAAAVRFAASAINNWARKYWNPIRNLTLTDPDEEDDQFLIRPIGGLSTNEVAAEVRYRFGDYGVVAFVDAGQVYNSSTPNFSNMRYGIGIGGRFYTNFGPLRLDVATPIGRKEGESLINVYISIGQAF